MTDVRTRISEILERIQGAVAAKDLDDLAALWDDDAVLIGTSAANLDRAATLAYLAAIVEQPGTLRWEWESVVPLVDEADVLAFAAVGSIGVDNVTAAPPGVRDDFRLTVVAVRRESGWRLRHFHGSVPEQD